MSSGIHSARFALRLFRPVCRWGRGLCLLLFFLWVAVGTVQAQQPDNVTTTVEYDAASGSYTKVTKVGDMVIGREYMSFEEYQNWQMDQLMKK